MKKLAIGCGVVLLLAIVAGGFGIYYVMHRFGSTIQSFSALAQIPDIEQGIENTSAFTPPDSGEFTGAQLAQLLAVQSAIRQKLGDRFAQLEDKYRSLSQALEQRDANVLDVPSLLSAYSDLATSYLDAKRWQVEALNAQHLSLEEYRWIRKQGYAALGVPVMNVDIGQMISDAKAGRTMQEPAVEQFAGPSGPEQNLQLAEPHRKELEDNAALAFLGL